MSELVADRLFAGESELAGLMAAKDWSETTIGSTQSWPQSLRSALSICVGSSFPIAIYWGDELNLLYNDAWSPILGNKHPWALGRPAKEVWPEIWDAIEGDFEKAMREGVATYNEDSLLAMHRHGYTEECYFNFTFTPIRDESGKVGGVFNAVIETTFQVINARRNRVLRNIAEHITGARSVPEACDRINQGLAEASQDVPFAAVYWISNQERIASLCAHSGTVAGSEAAPLHVSLSDAAQDPWSLCECEASGHMEIVDNVAGRFPHPLTSPHWPEAIHEAMVAPIVLGASERPNAFLIVGANPRRAIDEDYKQFAEHLASHIATALRTAQAYDEERQRAEALAELDRAKTTFFSNISHEFRTPLTLMLGPTEDLLEGLHGSMPAAQRTLLETMHRNQLRLQKLVNTLLDFSRIEAGRVKASFQPVLLDRVTADLSSTFRAAIERAGLEFTIDCESLQEEAYIDRDMWEKIVLNLLSNALKFTFEGHIRVSLQELDGTAVLRVWDTGVGVSQEHLPRLFERFHRIEGGRARSHEGSGIGLALVQELVKFHGGSIAAESVPGRGTTIQVQIPLGKAHLPASQIADAQAPDVPPQRSMAFVSEAQAWLQKEESGPKAHVTENGPALSLATGASPRVLLVDDNADMREYMRRLLATNYRVDMAVDGADALAQALAAPPDLVLSDVMMPRLDGFGLLSKLREDPRTKSVPVIVLSARAGEEAKVEGLQAGADDYVTKPFSAKELLARIKTQLEVARLRRTAESERVKLRDLFSQVPASIAMLRGPEHVFEFANPSYIEITGNRPLLGLSVREAFPDIAGQGFYELLDKVFQTGETVTLNATRVLLNNNTDDDNPVEKFIHLVYQPSRTAEGTVDGILVFAFDVTDQVRDRERLEEAHAVMQEAKQSAEAAVKVRDDFLSIASHELRTPLTTLSLQIDGALQLLESQPQDSLERVGRKVLNLRKATDRLEGLIDSLLDGAQLIAGRIELQRERVSLSDLAHTVAERFQEQAARTGSTIEIRSAAEVIGYWDIERLDQVITNLLANAVRYGEGKAIEVSIEDTQQLARLSVQDHGPGIDKKHQARIFERFERASSDRHFGGMGLGLWSARKMVEAMGGSIRVSSQPGQGATFTIDVPRNLHDK